MLDGHTDRRESCSRTSLRELPITIHSSSHSAFTLAEVLITLGIIGVVAAMSIPTLVKNYQKQVTVERLKQAYSVLNSAFLSAAADQSISYSDLFEFPYTVVASPYDTLLTNFVQTTVLPYVQVIKDCPFQSYATCGAVFPKYLNGTIDGSSGMKHHIIFLKNGASLAFIPNNNGTYFTGMIIRVDINGNTTPNVFGKDVFQMLSGATSKKITFVGDGNSRNTLMTNVTSGCNSGARGLYCGALIMLDNWGTANYNAW